MALNRIWPLRLDRGPMTNFSQVAQRLLQVEQWGNAIPEWAEPLTTNAFNSLQTARIRPGTVYLDTDKGRYYLWTGTEFLVIGHTLAAGRVSVTALVTAGVAANTGATATQTWTTITPTGGDDWGTPPTTTLLVPYSGLYHVRVNGALAVGNALQTVITMNGVSIVASNVAGNIGALAFLRMNKGQGITVGVVNSGANTTVSSCVVRVELDDFGPA